jgi:hypothetical protein
MYKVAQEQALVFYPSQYHTTTALHSFYRSQHIYKQFSLDTFRQNVLMGFHDHWQDKYFHFLYNIQMANTD